MRYLLSCFTLAVIFSLTACNTTKTAVAKTEMAAPAAAAPSYAGTWVVTVEDTPLGTSTGTMKLTEVEGKLTGVFITSEGKSLPLNGIVTSADGMSASFYFPQYDIDVDVKLKGNAAAEMLIGQSLGEYRTTAKRVE